MARWSRFGARVVATRVRAPPAALCHELSPPPRRLCISYFCTLLPPPMYMSFMGGKGFQVRGVIATLPASCQVPSFAFRARGRVGEAKDIYFWLPRRRFRVSTFFARAEKKVRQSWDLVGPLSRGPWNHVRLDTESSAGVTRLLLCLGYTVSGAGGSRAAVAGARRPIAQAKISSETVARIIGGASFYAPQHSHPCVACQLTR